MNLGQVYTKKIVADFMVKRFSIDRGRVLDPCFGQGVFINSLLEHSNFMVDGVEIHKPSFVRYRNPDPARCTLMEGDFFDIEKEYDGIIMNPPYVRHEEIEDLSSLGVTKRKLQSACGMMTISGKANLYMYFILRAILLLRDGGELVAIFPNSWTNTPVGFQFREQMNRFGCITEILNVEGDAFEGNPLVDVCILKYVKGGTGETAYGVLHVKDNILEIERTCHPEQRKAKGLVLLKSVANVRRGITTGANNLFVNPPLFTQTHLVDILSSPKDIKGFTTNRCRLDKLLAIDSQDNLHEEELIYLGNCASLISRDGKPKTLKTMIDKGKPWYYITIPNPAQIIFAYIVRNNMRFVLNEERANVRDNFYMISSSIDPFLLLALLNNYHVYSQLERIGKSYGKGLLKLQKYDINAIEIPSPDQFSREEKQSLIELAKGLISTSDESKIDTITSFLAPVYATKDAKVTFLNLKKQRLSHYA